MHAAEQLPVETALLDGETGPGFTAEYLSQVRRELAPLEQRDCPFEPPPPG